VDHPASADSAAERVRHFLQLFAENITSVSAGGSTDDSASDLSPHFLANLKRSHSVPRIHQLLALSHRFHLTLGGAFKIFGFDLDRLQELNHHLNHERTRFVESYSFDRDRPVDVPAGLGAIGTLQRTAFLAELVSSWQEAIPIRSLAGPNWQRRATVYARIGTRDRTGLPKVPPGSLVAIEPVSLEERLAPNPEWVYFLQHGNAYLACACAVQDGRLFLITKNGNYAGQHDFLYPQEIRVVGRISSFSLGLPIRMTETAASVPQGKRAPLILPWEHNSLQTLLNAERTRLGVTEAQVRRASGYLRSAFGISLSPRTLRRYEHQRHTLPNTGVLLAMTIVNSLRFTDVLKAANLPFDDMQSYSLEALLKAKASEELPRLPNRAISPTPADLWQLLLRDRHEWPTLLSMAFPNPRRLEYQVLRIRQSSIFKGLDSLIRPGSIVLLDESTKLPNTHPHRRLQDWERPVYALQHKTHVLCGYLDYDGTHVSLVPHSQSGSIPRLTFLKHQVQLLGAVIGVASPL
jgi:hypothetical protein